MESFQQVMNLVCVWVHASWGLSEDTTFYSPTISTLVSCGSTHFFDYNHVILPSTTNIHFNKILQTTQQPKTLDGAAQDLHVRMMDMSKWWEREILLVWHAFSFRFFEPLVSFACLVFLGIKMSKHCSVRWVTTMGHLMYFVKVNVVIHVYKTHTLLNSYWRADPPSSMSWDAFYYAMYCYSGLKEYLYFCK